MKLKKLEISNFRSIESLDVEFPSFYTAISGKNNSGKSNLLKAIKVLFQQEPRYRYRLREEEISFSSISLLGKERTLPRQSNFRQHS